MSRTLNVTEDLHKYLLAHSSPPDEVQQALIEETRRATADAAGMQISPDEGAFLTMITRLLGARNAVEVGTFTGYSSLCIARGLGRGGRLLCCDISEEWTAIARRHWKLAGVDDRIDLRIAPALETIKKLSAEPLLDLAFIDADKGGYRAYWDELVPRVRSGGVLLVDNTLWSGNVAKPVDENDTVTPVILDFNAHAAADARVDLVVLSISDGITMAMKR